MQVLYLNLERPDQIAMNFFLRTNAGIADFRRIDAVDGQCLDVHDLILGRASSPSRCERIPPQLRRRPCRRRNLGTVISTASAVTVAEDDAVFNRHFSDKAGKVLAALPPDWDIILWGSISTTAPHRNHRRPETFLYVLRRQPPGVAIARVPGTGLQRLPSVCWAFLASRATPSRHTGPAASANCLFPCGGPYLFPAWAGISQCHA